jgi:PAS domain S-box-containing protein
MSALSSPAFLISSLGRISSLLNKAASSTPELSEALGIICGSVKAGSAAIYRRLNQDSGDFQIECMAVWPGNPPGCSSKIGYLRREDFDQNDWAKLASNEFVWLNEKPVRYARTYPGIILMPLLFGDSLFGFLCMELQREVGLDSLRIEFLNAVCSVFGLWLGKMDAMKKFDDLIEFLPDATIGVNNEGIATAWNPAVEKMTGWKADRIIGKGDYEYALPFYDTRRPLICNLILHPDPKWEATYVEFRKEGDIVHSLIFCPALTGGGAFVTGATKKMRDIVGSACGSIHIVRDVTRERQIETQLQSSESLFKTITDYAGLGIALFQKEKALYYNERFEGLLGISGREISLADFLYSVNPEERSSVSNHLEKMFQGTEKEPIRIEIQVKLSGEPRDYSSYAQALDYGGSLSVCFVLDDITEQKKLARQARLNELRLYHEGRLTSLGIMAAGIAHELNQPLNTIRVVADSLLYGREKGWSLDPEELYENMEMISRQVLRMSDVIQNVRNFAREDREQLLEDINLNQAVKNVLSMIGRQFQAHDIAVEKKLKYDLPPVRASLNRIEQVVMNLLVNARQALDDRRSKSKQLTISTAFQGGWVLLEVEDNATGIQSDVLDHIFDPFFTTKEVGEGTGLGLTISQSIISEFGGSIEAHNNERGGATFLVKLPAAGGRS